MENLYKIIIAEDEPIICKDIAEKVMQMGLPLKVCALAENGGEALEAIKTYAPHILITDIKMPEMNGLELIRRVRKEFPDNIILKEPGQVLIVCSPYAYKRRTY